MPARKSARNSGNAAGRIVKGDVRAAAEILTLIENRDPRARPVLKALYSRTGKAHIVGVTGAAGTGKSTLIDGMTALLRRRKKRVGILTVDPTSPFSGGALLGDRIRMRSHFLDDGVFIRSLATRGGYGGLPASIREAVHLLDAMGKEIIFVETIGVGQDETEVSTLAHTVVVVLIPSMGDEVQAMKAGLLEVGDLLVVNKTDLTPADGLARFLEEMSRNPRLRILKTCATKNEGVAGVIEAIDKHRNELLESGNHRARDVNFCRRELLSLLQERMLNDVIKKARDGPMETMIERVARREIDPYTAADAIAKKLWN